MSPLTACRFTWRSNDAIGVDDAAIWFGNRAMKILLLGADGQVGYELHRAFAPLGEVLPYTYHGTLPGAQRCGQIDFEQVGALARLVRETRPGLVLNAVAHTAVDRAEDEPAKAQRVNADAVGELAAACKAADARLVH